MNLIVCFDKYAVALRGGQAQLFDDVKGEIPDSGSGGDLEYLKGQEENHRLAGPSVAYHINNKLSLLGCVFIPRPYRLGSALCVRSGGCSAG